MRNNYSKVKWPKLPKVFKRKWVKALRSGEYKQGEGQLYKDGEYCCLGVACKVGGQQIIYGRYISNSNKSVPIILRGSIYLPDFLSQMNDSQYCHAYENQEFDHSKGRSFKQIANFIERYL